MPNLRSTFPLDETAINRAVLGKIAADPITWVPLVPVVAAYTMFDVSGLIAFPLGVVILAGVGAYWRQQWSGLAQHIRRAQIFQHNRAQDALLLASAEALRRSGGGLDCAMLREFVAIKCQVENRLHGDGVLTPQKIQLEQLVDSLCFGVCDQLTAVARHEKDRAAVHAQVTAAYETLKATVAELDLILDPAESADFGSPSLVELTRRLKEEAEIARRVQARLHAAESGTAPPPLPVSEG